MPLRSSATFFLAVFFVFAPLGALVTSSFSQSRPWYWWAITASISGALAVSWAAAFTLTRWFVVGIVLFTLGIAIVPQIPQLGGPGRGSLEALAIVLSVALGYVLFVVFISGQGRASVRMQAELELARNIHETLVPPIATRDEHLEVLALSSASTEMGGDLVDAIAGPSHTDLFLIDVSGHGVRAGVVMGMIKSAIRMGIGEQSGLGGLAGKLNDVIESTTSAELYATFAGMRIEHRTRSMEYLLAGHHHIALHRAATNSVDRLAARGLPLGLMAGSSWETHTAQLETGDLLLVYTDGLNETMDANDEELGHDEIDATVRRLAAGPLQELQAALFALSDAHGPQVDDRSLLLVRMLSSA